MKALRAYVIGATIWVITLGAWNLLRGDRSKKKSAKAAFSTPVKTALFWPILIPLRAYLEADAYLWRREKAKSLNS